VNNLEYKTTSLALAAYLVVRKIPIKAVRGDKKKTFIFDGFDGIDGVVDRFFTGGNVSAVDYWDAIKRIKDMIYNN